MAVITRAQWGARHPRSMAMGNHATEAFIHHSENAAPYPAALTSQEAAVREIQNFHMDGRGWSDIAYHFIVFPNGRIFEGRDRNAVPAAQLNHNTNTLAICVFGDYTKSNPTQAALIAIRKIIHTHPSVRTVGGHRDVTPTECPGDNLYQHIPSIAKAARVRVFKG